MLKRILKLGFVAALITAAITLDNIFNLFSKQFPDLKTYSFLILPVSISLVFIALIILIFTLMKELIELAYWWRLRRFLKNTRCEVCLADDLPRLTLHDSSPCSLDFEPRGNRTYRICSKQSA